MNAQELRTKVANRAAKGGCSSDVVYVHDNVPCPLGNETVRLYSLQTERDGVKASFMIEGERAMRIALRRSQKRKCTLLNTVASSTGIARSVKKH